MKENGFTLEKVGSWRCPTQTIMDVNYADDIALLAESQLHSLEKAAGGISLHVLQKNQSICALIKITEETFPH